MDIHKIKKIYCIGIGGIGVSAVARWALHHGMDVFGSDILGSEITSALKKEGANITLAHQAENVPDDADMVVYTPAADEKHVERIAAKKKKIPQLSYPEFLGLLSEKKFTIAVTGTHGKSTATAMVALMLQEAGFDPTVFVGSIVPHLEHGNVRVGQSNFLVVEACEHQGNMRHIQSNIAVITSIEPDHLDFYENFEHELEVYQEFVDQLPKDGVLIKYAEDKGCGEIKFDGKTIVYGKENTADVYYSGYAFDGKKSNYHMHAKVEGEGYTQHMNLGVPGEFNVLNVLAAGSAAYQVGVPGTAIAHAAEQFSGIWRRFERVGEYKDAVVISDYAHHPTAIRETLAMTAKLYPKRRKVLVYQPHQHNRTKNLFNDFVDVFAVAPIDLLVLNEIYDVAGREEEGDQTASSVELADASRKKAKYPIHYTATHAETLEWIEENVQKDDVLLIMGAGDIDGVARELVN